MARLGDLFLHIRNGANIKQGLDSTGYPITRIETISNRTVDRNKMGYAGIMDIEKYSDYIMQDGDILMSHINSETHLGKTALYEKEDNEIIIHGMNLLSLRPNKDLITCKYAFYYLSSQSFLRQIPNITKKSVNQASFTVSALKELVFPLTSIEEQKKITADLDKVNDLISFRKQQLSKLDELVKSRFIEMFGDINTNDRNWDCQPLGELCTIVRGGSPRPIENFLGGDVPWIKIGDATKGDTIYLHATKEHIIQEGVKKSRLVKSGSLIFANCGVSLGFARIITFDGCIHDGWLAMEDIDVRLDKVFLLQALNQMTDHFRKIAPAGTQPNLNTAIMKAYVQIIPPMELQKEYIAFVEQTDKSKFEIQQSLEKLETLKKALMQKYFG